MSELNKDEEFSKKMDNLPSDKKKRTPEDGVSAVRKRVPKWWEKALKLNEGDPDDLKHKVTKIAAVYLMICCIFLGMASIYDSVNTGGIDPAYENYSVFLEAVEDSEIFGAYLSENETVVYYQYKSDISEEMLAKDPAKVKVLEFDKDKWCYTNYLSYDSLKETLMTNDIPLVKNKFNKAFAAVFNLLLSLTSTVITFYFMYLLISMFVKQMNISTQKFEISRDTGVRFTDVIGHPEVIEDIRQYMVLLTKREEIKDMHVKAPKGILFTGVPGTGKTLLARALAGEVKGCTFIYLNTSNVIEMYVGVGAKTIRECFKKARELAPCIVFLDEIDAIGGGRGSNKVGSSEDTQTLLALLQEMDGFSSGDGVLVIGATNCPETLDPALKRSGRFDREIIIQPPRNAAVREEMIRHYTKNYQIAKDVNLYDFAKQLANMTGSDIANICNEAAVVNMMRNEGKLGTLILQDFNDALDKLMLKGNKVNDKDRVNLEDKKIVAYHEAGHAVVTYLVGDRISRISIQGTTSGVGGFVQGMDLNSQFQNIEYLFNRVRICYGGRCSEIIKFGEKNATTGASNDIEQATNILTSMFLKYGFSEKLGMLDYENLIRNHLVDASVVYQEVEKTAMDLMSDTMHLLKDNYYLVEELAVKMLDCETLPGRDAEMFLDALVKQHNSIPESFSAVSESPYDTSDTKPLQSASAGL